MPVSEIIINFKTNLGKFMEVMNKTGKEFKKWETQQGRLNKNMMKNAKAGGRLAVRIRKLTHGFRGFRMEMLGVMFFGMGIQKFFAGLLRPTLDLVGAFDVMNTAMAIGLLGTGQKLLGWALGFSDWMTDQSPLMQHMIGEFTLWGGIIGAVTFLIGMFALGIGSIIQAFNGALVVILVVGGALFLIALAIGGLIFLWKNWDRISAKTKKIIFAVAAVLGGLLLLFVGWIGWIPLAVAAIIVLMDAIKNSGGVIEWLKEKFQDFKEWLTFIPLFGAIIKTVDNIKSKWNSFFSWLGNKMARFKEIIGFITAPIKAGMERFGIMFPKSQFGGFVPQTGLRLVHAGETVIPSSQNLNFNPTVNITSGGGGVDANMIKSELNEMWARQLANLARR